MVLGQLLGHELHDVGRDLELVEVDRRDAVLLREEVGELRLVEDPELGEAVAEACAGLALLFLRLLELRQRDEVLADEQLSQSTHRPT